MTHSIIKSGCITVIYHIYLLVHVIDISSEESIEHFSLASNVRNFKCILRKSKEKELHLPNDLSGDFNVDIICMNWLTPTHTHYP
jgi:hypothetical protein